MVFATNLKWIVFHIHKNGKISFGFSNWWIIFECFFQHYRLCFWIPQMLPWWSMQQISTMLQHNFQHFPWIFMQPCQNRRLQLRKHGRHPILQRMQKLWINQQKIKRICWCTIYRVLLQGMQLHFMCRNMLCYLLLYWEK